MEDGLKTDPDNLFLLRERLDTAVRRGDRAAVNETTAQLRTFVPQWDALGRETFAAFDRAVGTDGPISSEAADSCQQLVNVVASERDYQRSLLAASAPTGLDGEPIAQFLRLAPLPVHGGRPRSGPHVLAGAAAHRRRRAPPTRCGRSG